MNIRKVRLQTYFILAVVQKDVITAFCHFIHFFPSRQAGETWIARHSGTVLLSIYEGHIVAWLKNQAQSGQILG